MTVKLSSKDIGADLQICDLPANINHLCVGHNTDCDPQSPQVVVIPILSNPIDENPDSDEDPPVFEMDEVPIRSTTTSSSRATPTARWSSPTGASARRTTRCLIRLRTRAAPATSSTRASTARRPTTSTCTR